VPGSSKPAEYTDGRLLGDWHSKYPPEARNAINWEAKVLAAAFVILTLLGALFLSLSSHPQEIFTSWWAQGEGRSGLSTGLVFAVDFRLVAIFLIGNLGGTTFSIKWLVHSVAKCKWHLDRRYWRLLVPMIGGVYACVVVTLFDGGLLGNHVSDPPRTVATTAALAFLVGYFSDGVSGLLSNIANAVFGTLEKK